ncbi:hypothetical protein [Pseudorhodoferax sp. Leaf267]|uniref:hypothetical protein n=1 Tax=Pseudorhodoferax sp. Leaf267 TaxID=1736316 RepID=UPI0006F8FE83|nr:hypothetical protein [Pseudorhodoferax sp. Leaf267]KQP11994.1 hypothetical protein ASF43_23935 [Pseudorhodoferax sp. Leaf267]
METVCRALGNGRYDQLQAWLDSPAQRVRRVLDVTTASWWPDGAPPTGRRAAARAARAHADHAGPRGRALQRA